VLFRSGGAHPLHGQVRRPEPARRNGDDRLPAGSLVRHRAERCPGRHSRGNSTRVLLSRLAGVTRAPGAAGGTGNSGWIARGLFPRRGGGKQGDIRIIRVAAAGFRRALQGFPGLFRAAAREPGLRHAAQLRGGGRIRRDFVYLVVDPAYYVSRNRSGLQAFENRVVPGASSAIGSGRGASQVVALGYLGCSKIGRYRVVAISDLAEGVAEVAPHFVDLRLAGAQPLDGPLSEVHRLLKVAEVVIRSSQEFVADV